MPVQKYVPSFIAEFVLLLYVVVQQILTTYMHVLNGHFLRNKIKILANNQIIIFRGLCLMFWVSGCVSTPLYNVLMFLLVSFFMYLVLLQTSTKPWRLTMSKKYIVTATVTVAVAVEVVAAVIKTTKIVFLGIIRIWKNHTHYAYRIIELSVKIRVDPTTTLLNWRYFNCMGGMSF
jgi:hypothetical protein